MLLRIMLCSAITLAPTVVAAQGLTMQQLREELTSQLQPIQTQLNSLENDVKAVTDLAERVAANEESIRQLNQRLDALTTVMNDQDEDLRRVVEAISTQDTEGQYVPNILSNMQRSPEFKQDVSRAVHDSLQTEGTFTVENKTNSHQRIWINRTEYGINANGKLTLEKVPVGTVTTQLPGQRQENWTVGAPDYSEQIEIVPTETTTVYRPLTTVSSPVTTVYSPVTTTFSPVTTVYSPLTTTFSPVTTVYSPVTTTFSPLTTAYSPAVSYVSPPVYYYRPVFRRRWLFWR